MRRRRLAVVVVLALGLAACDSGPVADGAAAVSCAAGAIKAQGSSAQITVVNVWIRNYQVSCPDATIEYESVGSGAGLRAFI
ncbi:MAG TPA: substrate-binding domain-containing protein, partial [Catenuloplanes sp.]